MTDRSTPDLIRAMIDQDARDNHPRVKSIPGPAWDACEDCLATGGLRDAHGEGSCGSCGGTGRRPANAAAREEVRRAEAQRVDAMYDRAEAELDGDR